ncbi:MAG: alpha/beta fold hydrolase [Actinobacteria bacterium]|nr:alpha/beta fold hydrolase [Actinomycetota bacterium]
MTHSPEIGTTIEAAGLATNVHDTLADPGAGTVLLIHGSGPGVSAYANWRLNIPALRDHFRVIAPDIVGFGFTEHDCERYNLRDWTNHVVAVLDALRIDQAHVVGNSFGGSLALAMAIHHPSRVRRLGLMGSVGAAFDITPGLDAVWGYEPSVEAMRALLEIFTYSPSPQVDELAELRYRASIRPGVWEAFSAMFPAPRQGALDALTHADGDIAGIAAPTMIFHGREDRVIPLATSLRLLELIPDAQLHVFGRCGHWTQIEHADEFNRILIDFLLG